MKRIVRVSGVSFTLSDRSADDVISENIFAQTLDMDSIVKIEPLPITGDDRKFVVTGTPH